MMQLLCNGVVLDLYDNAGLQFTHKNPLFAFDSVACERTTQFKLPATPTNDSVLSVARVPAYSGAGMRQKFAAELQAGMVVQSGYLYVSNFDGKDYNAVFVTGELLGLQNIKNLGKIADFMTYSDTVRIGDSSLQPYTARQNGDRWQLVNYSQPQNEIRVPSICLEKIYNDIVTAKGITAAALPTEAAQLWLISQGKGFDEPMQFKNDVTDGSQPVGINDPDPANPLNEILENTTVFDYEDTIYEVQIISSGGNNRKYKVRQFRAKTDVTIDCPDDWPDTLYVYDLSLTHDDPDNYTHFYGGRYFESDSYTDPQTHIIPIGEPLKGRSFSVAAGECFSFVDSRIFENYRVDVLGQWFYNYGFRLDFSGDGEFSHNYYFKVKSESTVKNGELCRLQDNLPAITFTDLLKVFAAVSGKVLNYDEANGITFEELDFSTWGSPIDLTPSLTKMSELQRTFSDYAQQSHIEYRSDDTVRERIRATYEIYNDNIAQEKTLLTIPFSEGDFWTAIPVWVFVDKDVKTEVLGSDMSGSAALWRVALPKNSGVQTLCSESTQIKIECRMPLMQYHAIGAKTLLMVHNKRYVWVERSWQKDTAKFTLAQLP